MNTVPTPIDPGNKKVESIPDATARELHLLHEEINALVNKQKSNVEPEITRLSLEEVKDSKRVNKVVAWLVLTIVTGSVGGVLAWGLILYNSDQIGAYETQITQLNEELESLSGAAPSATGSRIRLTAEEIRATVILACDVDGNGSLDSVGSSTIWDKSGLMYTNKHVIGQPQKTYNPATIKVNDKSLCAVGITRDIAKASSFEYIARPFQYSKSEDVALLSIVSDIKGKALPSGTIFDTLPFGESSNEALPPGSFLAIIGYPSVGYLTWTYTEGIVSGRINHYIKTDTNINPGNSGGTVLNNKKEYVGLPTYGFGNSGLNYVLSINDVRALKDWVTIRR